MKKSRFNLTHLHSTTLDPGYLVPFLLVPTLPNDSFRIGLSTFIRAQPMLAPLMHEVRLFTQYWFVPNRLVWSAWEEFITGGEDLMSTPPFPTVTFGVDDAKVGSLADYFGFPTVEGIEVSALPFRAYDMIWNERYRDEDLQQPLLVDYASGEDTTTPRELLSPSFAKDYFTTARPFTQRGGEVVVPVYENQGNSGQVSVGDYSFSLLVLVMQGGTIGRNEGSFGTPAPGGITGAINSQTITTAEMTTIIDDFIRANINTWDSLIAENPDYANLTEEFLAPRLAFTKTFPTAYWRSAGTEDPNAGEYITGQAEVRVFVLPNGRSDFQSEDPVVDGLDVAPWHVQLNQLLPVAAGPTTSNNIIDNEYGRYIGVDTRSPSPGTPGWTLKGMPWINNKIGHYFLVRASSTQGFSIRDLRMSSALQRYAERSLKWGNRYEEFIQREFGIKPKDARIQRPEYLGGGRGILNISEVLQTAEAADTGVGTMRGHGIASISQRPIRFRAPEHGMIIGLLSIRPKSVYTQGIDREWLKRSRLDFFTPELASIGMQEVLQQELFAQPDNKEKIFGYSDRYQEYRYQKPLVTGEFRGNLNFWNMSRFFQNAPELTPEFISMAYSAEDFKRPFQIQDDGAHSFVCMLKNHIRAYRPIPKRAKDLLR